MYMTASVGPEFIVIIAIFHYAFLIMILTPYIMVRLVPIIALRSIVHSVTLVCIFYIITNKKVREGQRERERGPCTIKEATNQNARRLHYFADW